MGYFFGGGFKEKSRPEVGGGGVVFFFIFNFLRFFFTMRLIKNFAPGDSPGAGYYFVGGSTP
ncbi:hypothetical protein, partial [Neisseria sp. P0004.S002]|uniref:hypothetical protein n=1 Tax=Neisseria sp. P0004.S002 TaxID=3436666 RepID=UPI003F7FACFC